MRSPARARFGERLEYRVDNWFSGSRSAKPLALAGFTLVIIGVGGLALTLFAPEPPSLVDALWHSWAWVADAGAHVDAPPGVHRAVALVMTLAGMLVFALLVGIVADEIGRQVDDLKKGRARVLEHNHVVVLNWSAKVLPLVRELCLASASDGGVCIAILANRPKEEMEDDLRAAEFDLLGSRVVCRSGSPTIVADLSKVSPESSKAIVVLSPPGANADQNDAESLRCVLCLTQLVSKDEPAGPHFVVELCDVDNVHLVNLVAKTQAEVVVSHDLIGRLMIQCARQPAMGAIMAELFSFDGSEMYKKAWPQLVGRTFFEASFAFEHAVPVGVRRLGEYPGDAPIILLNPRNDLRLVEGDQLICVAHDDSSYAPDLSLSAPGVGLMPPAHQPKRTPEKMLFVNWRRDLDDMIAQLDEQVPPGSVLELVSHLPEAEQRAELVAGGLVFEDLKNLTLKFRTGNTVLRKDLEAIPLEHCDSVLILADDSPDSDNHALTTLLIVRDIQSKRLHQNAHAGGRHLLVSEVLDPNTRRLVDALQQSDYIMSNDIVAAVLAQVAECRDMNLIAADLLKEEGSEFYLKSARKYVWEQEEVCFWDIMARARAQNEIAVGFQLAGEQKCAINPEKMRRRHWHEHDLILVLSTAI